MLHMIITSKAIKVPTFVISYYKQAKNVCIWVSMYMESSPARTSGNLRCLILLNLDHISVWFIPKCLVQINCNINFSLFSD